jgi:hypothetical protein
MGIQARPKLEVVLLCERCGLPIERLEDGLLLDWNNHTRLATFSKRGIILHGPEGGPCCQTWMHYHRGNWAIYNLADIFSRLIAHYGVKYEAKQASEQAYQEQRGTERWQSHVQ